MEGEPIFGDLETQDRDPRNNNEFLKVHCCCIRLCTFAYYSNRWLPLFYMISKVISSIYVRALNDQLQREKLISKGGCLMIADLVQVWSAIGPKFLLQSFVCVRHG